MWTGIGTGVVALAAMAVFFARGWDIVPVRPAKDNPPTIEFTWTPIGPTTLREFRGRLKMADDVALDFSTYRFEVVEAKKTVDLPIPGLSGKVYESDISLGLLESNAGVLGKKEIHIRISIADDAGQKTEIEKTVVLK